MLKNTGLSLILRKNFLSTFNGQDNKVYVRYCATLEYFMSYEIYIRFLKDLFVIYAFIFYDMKGQDNKTK